MDDEVIGPLIRQGRAEGRLAAREPAEVKAMCQRLLKAERIENYFPANLKSRLSR